MLLLLACFLAIVPLALRAQNVAVDLANPDVAAIAKLTDDLGRAIESGDFNRIADFYSPAAILLANNEAPTDRNVGKSVANRWHKMIGSNRARVAIHLEEVDVSGDLAYDRVSYSVTIMPRVAALVPGQTGTPSQELRIGRALEILRKEDGVWKYYRIMTNSAQDDQ